MTTDEMQGVLRGLSTGNGPSVYIGWVGGGRNINQIEWAELAAYVTKLEQTLVQMIIKLIDLEHK